MKAEPTNPNGALPRSLFQLESESTILVSLYGSLGGGLSDHRERDASTRAVDHDSSNDPLLGGHQSWTQQAQEREVVQPHERA